MSSFNKPNGRRQFLAATALGIPGGLIGGKQMLAAIGGAPGPYSSVADVRDRLSGRVTDEDYWRAVRELYPLTEERTYLNTGGLGPIPYPVLDTFQKTTLELARISETGHEMIEDARPEVAEYLGAAADEICFTRNATEGNSVIASGLDLRAGDEVILDSHAHPGGAIPWMNRQKTDGVRVRLFEPDAPDNETIMERLDALVSPRTRVIQISHITAPTGILLPADRIARWAAERDIWFHIDGAQSAGMIPIDLHSIGCDSWATSGHKWMGAPHGTGILFIRNDRLRDVVPTEVGAYSDSVFELPDRFDYIGSARRHESGTRNAALVRGIQAAVRFHSDIGSDRIRDRGLELTRSLRTLLSTMSRVRILTPEDPKRSGSMLTFKTDGLSYDKLYSHLGREHRLRCRIVTERELNAVRISLHIFNLKEDCSRIAAGVEDALDSLDH